MSLGSEAAEEIVWPEDLLDADSSISVEDRAFSQSPDGWKGLHSGSEQKIPKNESQTASDSVDLSSTNEHWDHDDRNNDGSNLRSVSPTNYARSEEDTDKWMHDKFDLLKIGPPPGLGIKRTPAADAHYSSGYSGHHQQYQSSRRGQPRVLEVPRPASLQAAHQGLHRHLGEPENESFSRFPNDELRPATKTPWPEDVRGDDIEKWGWPEDAEPHAGWGWPDAAANEPQIQTRPSTSTADAAEPSQQGAKLSVTEQQNLRQVNQRNEEMASIIAQLKLQEQIQYANRARAEGVHQQALAPEAEPALHGVGFSGATNPVSTMLGLPFQMQRHTPGGTVQYQLSNGRLIPNISLPQQLGPNMAPGSPTVCPSISHLFHAQNQLSQQSRPPVRPNQQTFLHPSSQLPAQAGSSQSSSRTGAGFMPGSRRAARLDESIVYPLKPGHLKKSELLTPSMPPSVPQSSVLPEPAAAASQAAAQQPLLPGLVRRESRPLAIVDPKSRQQLLPSGSASGNQLTRTDSNSSAAANHDKPGKKLITIVDPNNKQPVQLPVQPLGSSRLARSSSNISAASSDSNSQPLKRTIAIVDPQNKQPIVLPDTKLQPRQSITTAGGRPMQASRISTDSTRRTKTPITIVDPTTSAEVKLPDHSISNTAIKAVAPNQTLGRVVRARKPLAIVDPTIRSDLAAGSSAEAGFSAVASHSGILSTASAERTDAVTVKLTVADDETVHCSVKVGCSGSPDNTAVHSGGNGDGLEMPHREGVQ
ncbi:hypothetical protein WJX77_006923 [Trebouxia sp. C0004]